MQRIDIQVRPQMPIISILGSQDVPETITMWCETPALTTCDSRQVSVGIGQIHPDDDYPVTLFVCNTIPIVAEGFFATELTLKAGEAEVDGAVAATSQGKAGDSGMRFTLPWQGRTLLQFAAPNGYKEAKGGIQVPNSLDIYLSAVA